MFGSTSFVGNPDKRGKELAGKLGALQRIGGLTFFKDFTLGGLDADFALGSPKAFYSSTSGVPTITTAGYAATTANADVLKYYIAGNRTAAQETIVIKFTPSTDFANDGVYRHILDSDNDRRYIRKQNTLAIITFYPNVTDNIAVYKGSTTTPLANISYIYSVTCNQNPSSLKNFINGIQEGTENTEAWDINSMGTYFYIGSSNSGGTQGNITVESMAIFNRPLSTPENLTTIGLM